MQSKIVSVCNSCLIQNLTSVRDSFDSLKQEKETTVLTIKNRLTIPKHIFKMGRCEETRKKERREDGQTEADRRTDGKLKNEEQVI